MIPWDDGWERDTSGGSGIGGISGWRPNQRDRIACWYVAVDSEPGEFVGVDYDTGRHLLSVIVPSCDVLSRQFPVVQMPAYPGKEVVFTFAARGITR